MNARVKHRNYMRRYRDEQARREWFPRFGQGVAGFTNSLRFVAMIGGPDSTNLGSSLLPIVRQGVGAESLFVPSLHTPKPIYGFHIHAIPRDVRGPAITTVHRQKRTFPYE